MTMKLLSPGRITGIDISEGMLELGRQKIEKAGLQKFIFLQSGDAENIDFPDNSFDGISVSFGVRNFQNLERGLSEMYRVLRPGGKLVVLEFSRPERGFFLPFYTFYLRFVTPRIGKLFSGNLEAYKYLNESVKAFPEGGDFISILEKTGYQSCQCKKLSMGICTIYSGLKK
jgi:demethylmenaquinone methyltransferase/2-methoxy-6-polyprenyl-1,4-benzoquinol methylase